MAIKKQKQSPGVKVVRRDHKSPSEALAPLMALLKRLSKK